MLTQAVERRNAAAQVLVALGANTALEGLSLAGAVLHAVQAVDQADCRLVRHSRLFQTPCFPTGAGEDYINAVGLFETTLSPQDLLAHLHSIEADMGRQRVQRWGSRTMDLDLLAYDGLILPDAATYCHWRDLACDQQILRAPDTLILPHPRLAERAFVLIPLLDIAPDWRHPESGLTVTQMAEALPEADKQAVRPAIL